MTNASSTDTDCPIPGNGTAWSIHVCAAILVLIALYFARGLFVPIVTATMVYMVLRPLGRQISRFGIPPAVSAIGIVGGLLALVVAAAFMVVDPAEELIADMPEHAKAVKEKLSFIVEKLERVDEAKNDLAESTEEKAPAKPGEEKPVPVEIKQPMWISNIAYLSGTGNFVSSLTIIAALLYFLLSYGDRLICSALHAIPDFGRRRRFVETIVNVQEGLSTYLAKITLINFCLGVAVAITMWFLGMPTPALWGVMAFSFNFLPLVGAIAGSVVIFFVALINFDATYYAFVVTGSFLTLTSVEGQFITPSILGKAMRINPILVLLSIVVWGWMWGVMGMFLSVPILIATRMVSEAVVPLRPLSYVLGAEVPDSEQSGQETIAKTETPRDSSDETGSTEQAVCVPEAMVS